MDLQMKTGYEDSSHNTTSFVSTRYHGLWSSASCSNSCLKLGTFETNCIPLSPECHFQSFHSPICSDNQMLQDDFIDSSYNEPHTPFTDFLLQSKQFMNTTIPWLNSGSAFVEWKNYSPPFTSLQPRKSQSLHKRCIRFLNSIKSHKISSLNTNNGGKRGLNINPKMYDKLAIHRALEERKRREEMKKIVFSLRAVLPPFSKKSKAKLLLQTIDYVSHLKRRVELLEKRNAEVEAFLHQNSLHSHDNR